MRRLAFVSLFTLLISTFLQGQNEGGTRIDYPYEGEDFPSSRANGNGAPLANYPDEDEEYIPTYIRNEDEQPLVDYPYEGEDFPRNRMNGNGGGPPQGPGSDFVETPYDGELGYPTYDASAPEYLPPGAEVPGAHGVYIQPPAEPPSYAPEKPELKDKKREEQKRKEEEADKRNTPAPFCRWWTRPVIVAVGIGGGAWAGYISGHNREKFSGNVTIDHVGLCLDQSSDLMHFEFLLPMFISMNGDECVEALVLSPDQTLFFKAHLKPSEAIPSAIFQIPAAGSKTAPVGEYRVVFTLMGGDVMGPVFLGGVNVNGLDLRTNMFDVTTVPEGTQASLSFHYPDGPFAFN